MKKVVFCCILALLFLRSKAQTDQSYIALRRLVEDCEAIKYRIPPTLFGENEIKLYFEPFQILSVDELQQSVKLSFLATLTWNYPTCAWNLTDYAGIPSLRMRLEDMWEPGVSVPKATGDTVVTLPKHGSIGSNGIVVIGQLVHMEMACYLDLLDYPFDTQNCSMSFLEATAISLIPQLERPLSWNPGKYFRTGTEWQLMEYACITVHEDVTFTECWFTMARRSTFHVATVIFHVGSICVITLMVFWIPAESGEKISFLISLYISMTVYINFIAAVIPRSMVTLPRVVIFILSVLVMIGLVTAATTLVLKKYHQEERKEKKREKADYRNLIRSASSNQDSLRELIRVLQSRNLFNNFLEAPLSQTSETDDISQNSENEAQNRRLNANQPHEDEHSGNRNIIKQLKGRYNFSSLSHGQLDKMFFLLFFIISLLTYAIIFCI